ncbi:hypothetical protein [Parabacteroides chinchillae]
MANEPENFATQCEQWKTELLADDDWKASACRQSTLGIYFIMP